MRPRINRLAIAVHFLVIGELHHLKPTLVRLTLPHAHSAATRIPRPDICTAPSSLDAKRLGSPRRVTAAAAKGTTAMAKKIAV